jgi:hypothetical protein
LFKGQVKALLIETRLSAYDPAPEKPLNLEMIDPGNSGLNPDNASGTINS